MKRYVKEFANEYLHNPLIKEKYKEEIRRILQHCGRGNITDQEAIKCIFRLFETEE